MKSLDVGVIEDTSILLDENKLEHHGDPPENNSMRRISRGIECYR